MSQPSEWKQLWPSPQCPPAQAWRSGCLPLSRWGGSAGPASLLPLHSPPEESATQDTQIRTKQPHEKMTTTNLSRGGGLFQQNKALFSFKATEFTEIKLRCSPQDYVLHAKTIRMSVVSLQACNACNSSYRQKRETYAPVCRSLRQGFCPLSNAFILHRFIDKHRKLYMRWACPVVAQLE